MNINKAYITVIIILTISNISVFSLFIMNNISSNSRESRIEALESIINEYSYISNRLVSHIQLEKDIVIPGYRCEKRIDGILYTPLDQNIDDYYGIFIKLREESGKLVIEDIELYKP